MLQTHLPSVPPRARRSCPIPDCRRAAGGSQAARLKDRGAARRAFGGAPAGDPNGNAASRYDATPEPSRPPPPPSRLVAILVAFGLVATAICRRPVRTRLAAHDGGSHLVPIGWLARTASSLRGARRHASPRGLLRICVAVVRLAIGGPTAVVASAVTPTSATEPPPPVEPGNGTLQAAYEAASAGDELVLRDGNYTGIGHCVLEIAKNITVRAQNVGMAILDGENARGVVQISSGAVVLEGLVITKGRFVSARLLWLLNLLP